jgi:hypothetical protein
VITRHIKGSKINYPEKILSAVFKIKKEYAASLKINYFTVARFSYIKERT